MAILFDSSRRITMAQAALSQNRFNAGQTVMTAGINDLVQQGLLNPTTYLRRHLRGDWGDLDDGDRRRNNAALKSGEERLFSSYWIAPDLKLWIITEWDRGATTLLLPNEYSSLTKITLFNIIHTQSSIADMLDNFS
jgi:hypothetical protein